MHGYCSLCGLGLSLGDRITRTAAVPGWVHTACTAGESSPVRVGETLTCARFYFCSVIDGPKRGLLLGPYSTPDEAYSQVERSRQLAKDADPFAGFYGFGIAGTDSDRVSVFGK